MYSPKSPGLRYCTNSRPVLKYRSCFNTEEESELDRSNIGNYKMRHACDGISPIVYSDESIYKQFSSSSEENNENVVCNKPSVEVTKQKAVDGYIGFANLPNQVYWKAVKKGFKFNIMIVGQSGLGKSTLMNSLFLTDIYSNEHPGPTQRTKRTMSIEATTVILKEGGVNLVLTVIDTPGYGDAVDNSNCWVPIIDYIEGRYKEYLQSEMKVNRTIENITDDRVHCCLYCIQATGHSLKPLDVEFMKRLCDKVNIVPIITKSDMLTSEECTIFKQQILGEITRNNIKIYNFPELSKEDEDYELNHSLRKKLPFAVVGSNTVLESNGKRVRGREYPWGIVDIEEPTHCDFKTLRKMLICTHLEDLKCTTHAVHYEKYRHDQLLKIAGVGGSLLNFCADFDTLLEKIELELKGELDRKLREKVEKLKKDEVELKGQVEVIERSLQQNRKELETERRVFELEKNAWKQMLFSVR